jgi:hypothetical protein
LVKVFELPADLLKGAQKLQVREMRHGPDKRVARYVAPRYNASMALFTRLRWLGGPGTAD